MANQTVSASGLKPLRIVILSHYLPPHIGGIEMVAYRQAVELIKLGNIVTSISSLQSSQACPSIGENHKVVGIPAGNILERFGVPYPLFAPSLWWRVSLAVKDADIVHVHDSFYLSSLAGYLAARIYKKPLFVTQHVAMITHKKKLVYLVQWLVYHTYGQAILKGAKKIFVLNDSVAEFLVIKLKVSPESITHVSNGVDIERFYPCKNNLQKKKLRQKYGLPEKGRLILFVGRLVHKKGYDKVLTAWSNASFDLVFAGSSVSPKDLPVNQRLYNLGSLSQTNLAEVYRACDIFVLPSTDEGFPLSVQEAMASGLPIIMTDDKGYGRYQLNRKYMSLVKPTVKHISSEIDRLLNAPDYELLSRSHYGHTYAMQHFSWDKTVRLMLKSYVAALREVTL